MVTRVGHYTLNAIICPLDPSSSFLALSVSCLPLGEMLCFTIYSQHNTLSLYTSYICPETVEPIDLGLKTMKPQVFPPPNWLAQVICLLERNCSTYAPSIPSLSTGCPHCWFSHWPTPPPAVSFDPAVSILEWCQWAGKECRWRSTTLLIVYLTLGKLIQYFELVSSIIKYELNESYLTIIVEFKWELCNLPNIGTPYVWIS